MASLVRIEVEEREYVVRVPLPHRHVELAVLRELGDVEEHARLPDPEGIVVRRDFQVVRGDEGAPAAALGEQPARQHDCGRRRRGRILEVEGGRNKE